MELTVVEADRTRLPALLRIENASFTCPWSEESFREALDADPISIPVCLGEQGEVVGFACLMTVADEGELLNIAVDPAFRRMGAARVLMDACLSLCAEKQIAALYLEVRESNTPARTLYRSYGFRELGMRRNYYEKPRENAILMRLALNPDAEGIS